MLCSIINVLGGFVKCDAELIVKADFTASEIVISNVGINAYLWMRNNSIRIKSVTYG